MLENTNEPTNKVIVNPASVQVPRATCNVDAIMSWPQAFYNLRLRGDGYICAGEGKTTGCI